jgi:ketosteroid isomerase-like protein
LWHDKENPMNLITAIVPALCILVSSAMPASADDPVAEARAAIEASNAKFSEVFARGDAAALATLYTSDAMLFPPGEEVVRGNVSIGQYWKKAHEGGVASAQPTTTDVERSGDVAYETGKVELVLRAEGKPDVSASAKYLVVWKRQPDGVWKLHRDIWNDLPAAK